MSNRGLKEQRLCCSGSLRATQDHLKPGGCQTEAAARNLKFKRTKQKETLQFGSVWRRWNWMSRMKVCNEQQTQMWSILVVHWSWLDTVNMKCGLNILGDLKLDIFTRRVHLNSVLVFIPFGHTTSTHRRLKPYSCWKPGFHDRIRNIQS